jgi:hypothetical protein
MSSNTFHCTTTMAMECVRSTPSKDLLNLVDEEYESKQTRKLVYAAFAQLDKEAIQAVQAEKSALETIGWFRGVNNARIEAQQEAARVRE